MSSKMKVLSPWVGGEARGWVHLLSAGYKACISLSSGLTSCGANTFRGRVHQSPPCLPVGLGEKGSQCKR